MDFLNTDEKRNRRLVHLPMGRFGEAVELGVEMAKKEGGAAGRAASVLDQVLRDALDGYERALRLDEDDEHLWAGYIM